MFLKCVGGCWRKRSVIKTLAALREDLGLFPRNYMVAYNSSNYSSDTFFQVSQALHTYGVHTYMQAKTSYPYSES